MIHVLLMKGIEEHVWTTFAMVIEMGEVVGAVEGGEEEVAVGLRTTVEDAVVIVAGVIEEVVAVVEEL